MRAAGLAIAVNLVAILSAPALPGVHAARADEAPAAARYYPLIGEWSGPGLIRTPDGGEVELAISLVCAKAAGGWAVRCDMTAKNDDLEISEADLMAVDPETGEGHWYAVTNTGETHDHIAEWTDPDNMKASYAWVEDGKKMLEIINVGLTQPNGLEFRSTITIDGQEAASFAGQLSR